MRPPVCHVFGAGDPPGRRPRIAKNDCILAADGGYRTVRRLGLRPDLLIGDFDSLKTPPAGTELVRLPAAKDCTDMLAALEQGLERGYTRFHLYGGTGGRLDHTLANVQCLAYLVSRGARGWLHAGKEVLTAAREVRLAARKRGTVSVFALNGPASGVTLRGLRYELDGAELRGDFPLGVSNAFAGGDAHIRAESGLLLVVCPAGTREKIPPRPVPPQKNA
jgi:thiamine pyrophosphokinase